MPVGLITNGGGANGVVLSGSTNDVDLFALLGSPGSPITYTLIIPSGVVIGSTASGTPGIDASGLDAASLGTWVVMGDIKGKGGDGGDGWLLLGYEYGGGGGGAGATVGIGGDGYGAAPNGANGTATAGGIGGGRSAQVGTDVSVDGDGENGADAVTLNHAVTIDLSGTIGGGGGGGQGGSDELTGLKGGDGGSLGDNGIVYPGFLKLAGAGGYAIRYSESGDATITGAGTTYGTIG